MDVKTGDERACGLWIYLGKSLQTGALCHEDPRLNIGAAAAVAVAAAAVAAAS